MAPDLVAYLSLLLLAIIVILLLVIVLLLIQVCLTLKMVHADSLVTARAAIKRKYDKYCNYTLGCGNSKQVLYGMSSASVLLLCVCV